MPGLLRARRRRGLGAVPPVPVAARTVDLRRPEPAVRRPRRRRPRRRADHRGRRASSGTRRSAEDGFGPARARPRSRSTRSRGRGSSSPTARSRSTSPTCRGDGLTDLVRDPQRRGLLLAEPRLRPLRRQGHDGRRALVRPPGPVRPAARPAGRHRRLAAPPTSSTCTATACGSTSTSRATAGAQPQRADGVPARRRPRVRSSPTDLLGNGTACLVWSSPLPGDARPADALRRPDGRAEAAPARRDGQQPRRRDARRLRAVDQVLPAGQARRAGRGSRGCRSRCTWSSGSRPTTASAATASSPATPTTTATSTASSASSAASAWSSSGTPRSSPR